MKRSLPVVLATLVLIAGACGDDDADTADTAADTPAATDAPAATDPPAATDAPAGTDAPAEGASLALATSDLGEIVVDGEGRTLYLFTPDAQGESTCYDVCAEAWPALGELSAVGEGLDEALLGTTTRTDDTVQATYNGWPLYYFANDAAPGDVNGQAVSDVWWVIDASGNAVGA